MTIRLQIQMGRLMSAVLVPTALLAVFCSAAAAQQFGPWSTPINLGATVNSACSDQHPALSKDGLTLIFASDRPLDNSSSACLGAPTFLHLWVTQRDCLDVADSACNWRTPQPLVMLNSAYQDMAPNLSTDGHWLFFHSRRPGGCNAGVNSANGVAFYQELWVAHRKSNRDDFGWETPMNLGCILNIPAAGEAGPTFWEDDSTGTLFLYFNRDLLPLGPDSDPAGNGTNIYVSSCTADISTCNTQQQWSPGIYVAELSSPVRDTRTAIRRRDGLEIIVTSNRTGGVGGFDSWVSTRVSAQDIWSIPIDLNQDNLNKCSQLGIDPCPVVNTGANDGAPALSWDGQTLLFYSNRVGGSGGNDLFMSARTKLPD
jgi:hypothetical protein